MKTRKKKKEFRPKIMNNGLLKTQTVTHELFYK